MLPSPQAPDTEAQSPTEAPTQALVNLRDEIFPAHRQRDLDPDKVVWAEAPIYGLSRFWDWILQVHHMWEAATEPLGAGESYARSESCNG